MNLSNLFLVIKYLKMDKKEGQIIKILQLSQLRQNLYNKN